MIVTVYGQIGDGPIMRRRVHITYFLVFWGRFSQYILDARKDTPFVVGDRKVWIDG